MLFSWGARWIWTGPRTVQVRNSDWCHNFQQHVHLHHSSPRLSRVHKHPSQAHCIQLQRGVLSGTHLSSHTATVAVRCQALPSSQVVPPASGQHVSSLVFLHGLGDTSDGLEPLAQHLGPRLPATKLLLPTAPTRKMATRGGMRLFIWWVWEEWRGEEQSAVAGLGVLEGSGVMMAVADGWSGLVSSPPVRRFDGAEDAAGVASSMDFIEGLVEAEVREHTPLYDGLQQCD